MRSGRVGYNPRRPQREGALKLISLALGLTLALVTTAAFAGEVDWRHEIRPAMEEAEGRGVPLLIYLTRDD